MPQGHFLKFFSALLFLSGWIQAQTSRQQVNLFNIPNQSVHFVRMPSRESSTEIDAVFTNPAGLTAMRDGFHVSVSNQFARQKIKLESDYHLLSEQPAAYTGLVKAMIFPGIYLAWKRKNWAVSGALLLAGGGGGATFSSLPSADMGIADIPSVLKISLLNSINNAVTNTTGVNPGYNEITGYGYEFYSYGVAYTPGYQVGATYKINDYVSAALAVRYLTTTSRSEGYLRDISILVPAYGGMQLPSAYLRFLSNQPDINPAQGALLNAAAALYDELAANRNVNVEQRGQGITPIIGVNVAPLERLNFGFKYEHRTAINLKTKVFSGMDGGGQYTDGEIVRSDFPGYVSAGAKYLLTKKWLLAAGSRYFFSKRADYNGREDFIRSNYFEVALAAEYAVNYQWKVSGGYTLNRPDVYKEYQNEVDFLTPGNTIAMGAAYTLKQALTCHAGILYTQFMKKTYTYDHIFSNGVIDTEPVSYNRTHFKNAMIFAVGVDLFIN